MTRLSALLLTLAVIDAAPPAAQPGGGTVRVTVPGVVLIPVDDVSAASASSSPARISFNQAFLAAGQALRISVSRDAGFAPGWFNLSHVLAEKGCLNEAQQARTCAVSIAPQDTRFAEPLPLPVDGVRQACQAIPACR